MNALETINFEDELELQQPDYVYEGEVPADVDSMDYVNINTKGVRLG